MRAWWAGDAPAAPLAAVTEPGASKLGPAFAVLGDGWSSFAIGGNFQ
jgi:hypothetical protein